MKHSISTLAIMAIMAVTSVFSAHVPAPAAASVAMCKGAAGTPAFYSAGDVDNGGYGVTLHNADTRTGSFCLFENADAIFPWKFYTLNPGQTVFVSVCQAFQGRIKRCDPADLNDGQNHWLGSLFEFSISTDTPQYYGWQWADVSLYQGFDGAISWVSLDNNNVPAGFSKNILPGAPANIIRNKLNGQPAIDCTVVNGAVGPNDAATAYENGLLDPLTAYIGNDCRYIGALPPCPANGPNLNQPTRTSTNGRGAVTFYAGTY